MVKPKSGPHWDLGLQMLVHTGEQKIEIENHWLKMEHVGVGPQDLWPKAIDSFWCGAMSSNLRWESLQ